METCKLAKYKNTRRKTRLGEKSKTKWRSQRQRRRRHKLCEKITNILCIARVEFKFATHSLSLSCSLSLSYTACKLYRLSVYTHCSYAPCSALRVKFHINFVGIKLYFSACQGVYMLCLCVRVCEELRFRARATP